MSTANIETSIVGGLKQTIIDLDKALVGEDGELTSRQQTQALRAIAQGVLMTIDNHYSCPALCFYLAFEKWVWPIVFGIILIGILGGAAAFRSMNLQVPAP